LRENKFEVISAHEKYKGAKDQEILSIAISEDAILLTEDKDFWEQVFAHKIKLV